MKYLKKFDTHNDYETYINSQDKIFPNISYCEIENEVHFNRYSVDYSKQYVRTKALESGTISFNIPSDLGTDVFQVIEYSLDNGKTWTTTLNQNSNFVKVNVDVNKGDKILWRGIGDQTGYIKDSSLHYNGAYFSSTARFNVDGNIMSLIYGNDDFENYTSLTYSGQFGGLFYSKYNNDSTLVVNAKNLYLPSVLKEECYHSMFYKCASLVAAPKLSATTLKDDCYSSMFEDCTSLVVAPELPATTLTERCYLSMFKGCTSLTTAPKLPAETLETACYNSMFSNCTSLTTAPDLPARDLETYCYNNMFNGCTNLHYIKALFNTTPSASCTGNWVQNVAITGTFVKNSTAEWDVSGYDGVPFGWVIKTEGGTTK